MRNNKALIFVPHQDDEINLAGGLIPKLLEKKYEVKVVYSTNGDYNTSAKNRYSDAIRSLKKLGVDRKNIIFMGYCDQYSDNSTHLYLCDDDHIWVSNNGIANTYYPTNIEFNNNYFKKNIRKFNRQNFKNDIYYILKKEMADYIFCIDFDSHPDHRALSLIFDEAMGIILNEYIQYKPYVYKGFAYPTSYLGINDFYELNIAKTKFNTEQFTTFKYQNPYINYDERVRFPIQNKCANKLLIKNTIFKALCQHKSQRIIGNTFSIINSDQIFWKRRTDNLLFNSKINVSSGNSMKLCDFKLFDCINIMHGNRMNPEIIDNCWVPDKNDNQPFINIKFKEKVFIDEIKLYHSLKNKSVNILIKGDNFTKKVHDYVNDCHKTVIKLDGIELDQITIYILDDINQFYGLSQVEIFESKNIKYKFLKLEIDGDFAYKYYYKKNQHFRIYASDGNKGYYLEKKDYILNCKTIKEENNSLKLNKKINFVHVELKDDPKIYDDIVIIKLRLYNMVLNYFINFMNLLCVKFIFVFQKVIRKIKKYLDWVKSNEKI